jgi:hypothetical protein
MMYHCIFSDRRHQPFIDIIQAKFLVENVFLHPLYAQHSKVFYKRCFNLILKIFKKIFIYLILDN